jgi:hypothetical protein
MRAILREDWHGFATWMMIFVVVIVGVVILLAALTLLGVFQGKTLSTTVVIWDMNGKPQTVYQDSGGPSPPAGSIASINGVAISQISWYTSFKVTSSGYTQFTATAAQDATGMFYGSQPTDQALFSGSAVQCPNYSTATRDRGTWGPSLAVGTTYDYGTLNRGTGTPPQAVQTATSYTILSYWGQGNCATVGTYWVRYSISITVQAVGQGSTLPTATYTEKVYTQVVIGSGTIAITGTSSAVGTWVGA